MEKEIIFRGEKITLKFFCYNDGRIGILMIHSETNKLWGNATLNLNCNIKNNEILVKSYGDSNYGLYEILLENNIINQCRRMFEIGLNKAHVCEVNEFIYKKMTSK